MAVGKQAHFTNSIKLHFRLFINNSLSSAIDSKDVLFDDSAVSYLQHKRYLIWSHLVELDFSKQTFPS